MPEHLFPSLSRLSCYGSNEQLIATAKQNKSVRGPSSLDEVNSLLGHLLSDDGGDGLLCHVPATGTFPGSLLVFRHTAFQFRQHLGSTRIPIRHTRQRMQWHRRGLSWQQSEKRANIQSTRDTPTRKVQSWNKRKIIKKRLRVQTNRWR